MRAGLMRDIVTFETPEETQDNTGFVRKEWKPVLTCKVYRKKLTAQTGDEMNADESFIENTVQFQTYRYPVINDSQRILWNGKRYRIVLLDPQQVDNTYLITCKKEND